MLQGSLPKGLQERNTIRVALKGPLVMFTARGFTSSPQGSFIWVPYVNPTILGLLAQGFLIRFLHYSALKVSRGLKLCGLELEGQGLGFRV